MSSSRTLITLGLATLLVGGVAIARTTGILNPDWSKPTAGTHEAPAAELGEKPEAGEPWSLTTMASSIDGKPVAGKPVTVVGEIVDLSCYLQVGKHGDKHRDCGQKCARAGQPVGLLQKDGTLYMLIDEEHDPRRDAITTFRQTAIDKMAHVVKVNGTLAEVDGQRAIYVQGFVSP
jgi:hypothetical protein